MASRVERHSTVEPTFSAFASVWFALMRLHRLGFLAQSMAKTRFSWCGCKLGNETLLSEHSHRWIVHTCWSLESGSFIGR